MTFPAGGGQLAFQGKVCPSQSDYFELQAACAGFVRAELHCKDEQGGADSVCDQGELELHLWHDTGETLVPRLVSASAYAKEVVHAPVEQGRWILEVRHASGSTTDYTLSVTSLPSGYCLSTAWICEADEQAIEATEASCEVLPSGSSCPSSDVYTQPVDLPRVFDGSSGWTPGFAVFAFPHEVRNPHTPTPSELTLLESRCIEACETHWANTPEVTATCNGSSFTDIVLRDMPSIPSRALIPTELEDGSDLFPAQGGLAYGLHDASVAFASNLHPFRQGRVQPAFESDEHGFHEQYVFNLSGSTVTLTGAREPTPLFGIVRFSDADAQVSVPRPVYIADLSFSSTEETQLELDCTDETQATPTIDAIAFFLTQPAFGVRDGTTDTIGFPPGALVYRMGILVGSDITWVDGANRVNVYGDATPEGIALQLNQVVRVACGTGTADVTAQISLSDSSTISHPPEITLDLPDWILCPNWITIDGKADVTDPQDDVESVRWWANGHLLAPHVVRVFGGHTTFSVVACDSRGGCTRAEHTVQCIPV